MYNYVAIYAYRESEAFKVGGLHVQFIMNLYSYSPLQNTMLVKFPTFLSTPHELTYVTRSGENHKIVHYNYVQ